MPRIFRCPPSAVVASTQAHPVVLASAAICGASNTAAQPYWRIEPPGARPTPMRAAVAVPADRAPVAVVHRALPIGLGFFVVLLAKPLGVMVAPAVVCCAKTLAHAYHAAPPLVGLVMLGAQVKARMLAAAAVDAAYPLLHAHILSSQLQRRTRKPWGRFRRLCMGCPARSAGRVPRQATMVTALTRHFGPAATPARGRCWRPVVAERASVDGLSWASYAHAAVVGLTCGNEGSYWWVTGVTGR